MKTLFFIRKKTEIGQSPIYLRITHNNKRAELSLDKTVSNNLWEAARQRVKGSSQEAEIINEKIKNTWYKLNTIFNELEKKGTFITAELLKASLQGKGEESKTILSTYDQYVSNSSKNVAESTNRKFKSVRKHIETFLKEFYHTSDMAVNSINLEFAENFFDYLKKSVSHNHALKTVQTFNYAVCVNARKHGLISHDPFVDFKAKLEDVEQDVLTEEELKLIIGKKFERENLNVVRNVFVFQCMTGLAYADVEKLTNDNIVIGIDSRKWIHVNRTKTNVSCRIPLNSLAVEILDKYKDHPTCKVTRKLFPMYSNQKMNEYLKTIGDNALTDSDKELTTHVARRTAATLMLNNGVDPSTIISVIGHKGFKLLHLYAKINENKIARDMQLLENKQWAIAN